MPTAKQIFGLLDKDNVGYITAQQLTTLMNQHGLDNNEQQVQEMINLVDTTGTGMMNLSAFCAAMEVCYTLNKSSNHAENSDQAKNEDDQNEPDEENTEETDEEEATEDESETEDFSE